MVQSCTSATLLVNFTTVWQDGWNPLMFASEDGHVEVVVELIRHGAGVDMQDEV